MPEPAGSDRPAPAGEGLLAAAGPAVAPAIAFALLAQALLVEACGAQFGAHVPAGRPLAGLAIAPAIPFAALAQPVPVFAGEPQLLTMARLSTSARGHANTTRSDFELNPLREGRSGTDEKGHHSSDGEDIGAH